MCLRSSGPFFFESYLSDRPLNHVSIMLSGFFRPLNDVRILTPMHTHTGVCFRREAIVEK